MKPLQIIARSRYETRSKQLDSDYQLSTETKHPSSPLDADVARQGGSHSDQVNAILVQSLYRVGLLLSLTLYTASVQRLYSVCTVVIYNVKEVKSINDVGPGFTLPTAGPI